MSGVSVWFRVRASLFVLTLVVCGGWQILPALASAAAQRVAESATAGRTGDGVLDGRGMWIWYVDRSAGGDPAAIVAQARASGVGTLFVKSSDGETPWLQFSPQLVRSLHAGGLRVCAWQYVYGTHPLGEAAQSIRAIRDGADCLIIDAEAEYEGRYAAAQLYLRTLRAAAGAAYPIALASFPYVDYHPAFPYSVFLGPGGAQYDLPQMYWRDIGASIADVFHHTYTYNRIYRRRILPVGQTYGAPTASEVEYFRAMTVRYLTPGISWWDFAWTSADALWPVLNAPFHPVGAIEPLGYPVLGPGSEGDDVLWLQEHLASEYSSQRLTGIFAAQTRGHLEAFQAQRRLPVTGWTDPGTWRALLELAPVAVAWAATGAPSASTADSPTHRVVPFAAPQSAALHARLDEIPELGAQHPMVRPGSSDPLASACRQSAASACGPPG
jgi:hypothetical protein